MPKKDRVYTRPVVRNEAARDPYVPTEVVANPVAQPVAPPLNTTETQLLAGLSALNPALQRWTEQTTAIARQDALKKIEDEEKAEASLGQSEGQLGQPAPPESTEAYRRGYMIGSGNRAGVEDRLKLRAEVEKAKYNPDFDLDRSTREFIAKQTEGLKDPHFLSGYAAQIGAESGLLQAELLKQRTAEQRAAASEALGAELGALVKTPGDSVAHVQGLDQIFGAYRNLGFSGDEIRKAYVQSVIAHATENKDLAVIDRALAPRGGPGPALVDAALRTTLVNARDTIARQKETDAGKELNLGAAQQFDGFMQRFNTDPLSIGDPVTALTPFYGKAGEPGKWINSNEELQSWIMRVRKAQDEAKGALAAQAEVLANPELHAHTAVGKKVIGAMYDSFWKGVDLKNPQAVERATAASVSLMQKTGLVDPHLKGVMSIASQARPEGGAYPEATRTAVHIWERAVANGATEVLGLVTSEADRIVLQETLSNVTTRKMGFDQAVDAAQRMTAPESKQRLSTITENDKRELRSAVEGLQSRGLFSPFTPTATNPNLMFGESEAAYRRYIAGGASHQSALKLVKEEMEARLVYDGHNNYLLLPNIAQVTTQRKQIAEVIKDEIGKVKQLPGYGDRTFYVSPSSDGSQYILYDTTTQTPVPGAKWSLTEIAQTYKAKHHLGPEDIAQSQNLVADFSAGRFTDAQVLELRPRFVDLYNKGAFKGHGGARLMEEVDLAADRARREAAVRDAQAVKDMSDKLGLAVPYGPPTAQEIKAVQQPLPQPGGGNPSVKQTAADALKRGNPSLALVTAIEGLSLRAYVDPNGKQRNIGYGYSLSNPTAKQDLLRAGVAAGNVDAVMRGDMAITPDQALNLANHTMNSTYVPLAAKAVNEIAGGSGAWHRMPANRQAAVLYLAWATGKPEQFRESLGHLIRGDIAKATETLKVHYRDGSGRLIADASQNAFIKAMMTGEAAFSAFLNQSNR